MIKKQDRTPVRKAMDIEQKYDLNTDFSQIEKMVASAQRTASDAKTQAQRAEVSVENLETSVGNQISELGTSVQENASAIEGNAQSLSELGERVDALEQSGGGSAGVASFNGREGAVVPQNGDYTAAMVGAAPNGYGLGGGGTACSDCNNATENGWYSCGGAANTPRGFAYGWMLVSSRSGTGGMIRQDYHSALSVPEHYQRHHVDGVWSEWECITPGLALGVEYRTTERFMGKPVYVCTVDFGALPNASKKRILHGCEVTGYLISAQAFVRYSDSDSSCITLNNYEYVSACFATRDYFTITTTTDMSGWQKAYVILKYTKATD